MTDPIIISAATGAGLAVGALPEREGPHEGEIRDVVIVGSGPAGYTAAVYTARANLAPVVLEGSVTAGGALMNTTEVENFPGFPEGIMGPDLMAKMQEQAEKFGAELVPRDVTEVDITATPKIVKVGDEVHRAHAVIVATVRIATPTRRRGIRTTRGYRHRVDWPESRCTRPVRRSRTVRARHGVAGPSAGRRSLRR